MVKFMVMVATWHRQKVKLLIPIKVGGIIGFVVRSPIITAHHGIHNLQLQVKKVGYYKILMIVSVF